MRNELTAMQASAPVLLPDSFVDPSSFDIDVMHRRAVALMDRGG